VNLAARLEQSAEPGGILVSRDTYALVREDIVAQAHVPVLAKGFAEPIEVYSVIEEAGEQPSREKCSSGSGSACAC
jgi:class 3 adenylate cyclase